MNRGAPWRIDIHASARDELLALTDVEFERVDAKLRRLAEDPLRPRAGVDIKKLKDLGGGGLYRLRIGERRALYAVLTADRRVIVLVVEDREAGYARMIARASKRLGS